MPSLSERVEELAPWHYEFEIGNIKIDIDNSVKRIRHQQRKNYFFDPLVKFMGSSLEGKRILDLGCNAGFWSLLCIEAGCDYVVGVDGRKRHIDQANLIFELNEIDSNKYEFISADIYELDFERLGNFDIVLCLGLFYHINKPMLLLEKISNINTEILVIDTQISIHEGAFMELKIEDIGKSRQGLSNIAMFPTPSALDAMLSNLDYSTIVLLPEFDDWTRSKDYKIGHRRCFVASKVRPLNSFPAKFSKVPRQSIFGDDEHTWTFADTSKTLPHKEKTD